jgi:flagellar hook-associated protein 3 FlgL
MAVSTAFFNSQASGDLRRVTADLADLQRQIGSNKKANDLAGFGVDAGRVLSANALISRVEARQQAATTLSGRLGATDFALGKTADSAETLREAVLTAVGQDDGRYLATALQAAFDAARISINTTFEGEALFGGERTDATPINVSTLDQLAAAPSTASIFDEGARQKTLDLGDGSFPVAEKASAVSTGLFDAMRQIKQLLDANGGTLPVPLTSAQKTALQGFAVNLESSRQTLLLAQGRNGETSKAIDAKQASLESQSNALAKLVGDTVDVDLAQVASKLSTTQVQYQAIAQTFSSLSHLSLLDFLK